MASSFRPYSRLLTLPLYCLATSILLNDHVAEILSVQGSSMSPSLSPLHHTTGDRDYLLVRKWRPTSGLQRGDVVAFWAPHRPGEMVVKRVVGMAGDRVYLDERRGGRGEVLVPQGHLWVEGDNWRASGDSNMYGPVSASLVAGRAVCVVWPWGRIGMKPWEDRMASKGLKTRVERAVD